MLTAQTNLCALHENPYPGRGLVVGLDPSATCLIQAYWIMGRSPNSRNRIFATQGGRLWTEAADPSRVKDPSLIIYNAMDELNGLYMVSNGDQTDTIVQAMLAGADAFQALNTRQYEPDAPNFTPRISAVCDLRHGRPTTELSVLKKSPFSEGCERQFFRYEQFCPGLGHCITTYTGDGEPLPPFQGEPYVLPLGETPSTIMDTFWGALNEVNRVALAVKSIELSSGVSEILIRNQYEKVET